MFHNFVRDMNNLHIAINGNSRLSSALVESTNGNEIKSVHGRDEKICLLPLRELRENGLNVVNDYLAVRLLQDLRVEWITHSPLFIELVRI
jgi:hypothetical protein